MKSLAFHKEQGPSIRLINGIMLGAAVIISAVLFWAMNRTTTLYNESYKATQNLLILRESADNLLEASDYLTEEMRAFVITGERKYLNNYFEEAMVDKHRENALDALRENNERSIAYQNLQHAMVNSVDLMDVEYYAAKLAIEGYGYELSTYPEVIKNVKIKEQDENLNSAKKLEAAQEMLFDDNYTQKKDHIRDYTENCLKELSDEVQEKQLETATKLRKQVALEHVLTVVLIVIVIIIVLLTFLLVIRPLSEAVESIRKEEDIDLKGAYEIRFLAKTYNLMYQTNLISKEKLNYEATHDKLTGLYNRRGYDFLLKNVDMETSALLIIDLDEFKKVNDTYGHDIGDKVLTKAADVIYNSFRNQDYICRIGGDEFAVIMVHSDSSLKELVDRKVELMNQKMKKDTDNVPAVTFSAGVAFGESGRSVEEIFKEADKALYIAKQEGKAGVRFSNN